MIKRRFSEEIADAIERKIKELGLKEGDRLPSHSLLAKELNVSIPSLREGLQQLSTLGVVRINQGVGTTVAKPSFSNYFRILKPILRTDPSTHEELIEIQRLLEEHIIRSLLGKRISSSSLNQLSEQIRMMLQQGNAEDCIAELQLFHRRLARLYGNKAMTEIINLVNHILFSDNRIRERIIRNSNSVVQVIGDLVTRIRERDSQGAEKDIGRYFGLLLQEPRRMAVLYDTFGTGSIGGSYHAIGRQLCRILRDFGDLEIDPEPTGGGIENVELTDEGIAILGLTQSDVAYNAYHGIGFFSEKYTEIRALCGAPNLDLWIIAKSSSGFDDLAHLRGKRIAMGALGGESSMIARAGLDVYGYREGDYRPFYRSFSNAIHGLDDGEIDVIFYLSHGPSSAILDLVERTRIRLLPVGTDRIEKILESHPYWNAALIPKDSLPLLERDIPSLGVSSLLITHREVPDDLVYKIVDTIMNHPEEMSSAGAQYKFELCKALRGVTIPLHEGAERYFREQGLLDAGGKPKGGDPRKGTVASVTATQNKKT